MVDLDLDRRQTAALLAATIVVGTGIIIAATTTFHVGSGSRFHTDSGMTIYPASDIQVENGNPFGSSSSLTLQTIRFNGSNSAARVDAFNASATWTNLSQVDVESGHLTVDRPDAREMDFRGTLDAVSLRSVDFDNSSTQVDFVATAGGKWDMTIESTGLAAGTSLLIRDHDTRAVVGSAEVANDGSATFTDMNSVSNEELDLVEGPSVLKVFKASKPSQLVDDVTLTVRIFDHESEVWEREVSDGTMPLTGIPKNEPLTITVKENTTDEYVYRRTVIKSVAEQQGVYLLNSSNTNVANVIFELDDRTGNYPPKDTILFVDRPITKDFDGDGTKETRYVTIVGDTFGTGSFPTILEADQRYRLTVENKQGDRRVIGSYTAQLDDRSTIRITGITIPVKQSVGYAASFGSFKEDTDGDGTDENYLRFTYRDPDRRTESIEWNITALKNGSTVDSGTTTGNYGTFRTTVKAPFDVDETSYKLYWSAERQQDDGTDKQIEGTRYAGDVPNIPLPIDPRWLELIGQVAIIAVAGLVVLVDPALGAFAATGTASLLTVLGIVDIPMPALALGGAISIVAIVGRRFS